MLPGLETPSSDLTMAIILFPVLAMSTLLVQHTAHHCSCGLRCESKHMQTCRIGEMQAVHHIIIIIVLVVRAT